MPGLRLAIEALTTRPFSICIVTVMACCFWSVFSVLTALSVLLVFRSLGLTSGRTGDTADTDEDGLCATFVDGAWAAAAGGLALKPAVTTINVDSPMPIKTAAAMNSNGRCRSRDVGAGGSASGSVR